MIILGQGAYFITICVKNRLQLLGKIFDNNTIQLTNIGIIAKHGITEIEKIYPSANLDEYIIMPNHIHMIIILNEKNNVSLCRILKQYKQYVSKISKRSLWQKSFYEHIIRNEQEYWEIKYYIKNNIENWGKDKYF